MTARIAQRFALVKIHKLWNAGRAEPSRGSGVLSGRFACSTAATDPAKCTEGFSSGQAAVATATTTYENGGAGVDELLIEFGEEDDKAAAATGAGEEGLTRDEQWQQQTSLASTVAGVAGLPQEVLRRIISYCTL